MEVLAVRSEAGAERCGTEQPGRRRIIKQLGIAVFWQAFANYAVGQHGKSGGTFDLAGEVPPGFFYI